MIHLWVFCGYISGFEDKMGDTSSDNPPAEDVCHLKFGFDALLVDYGTISYYPNTIPVRFYHVVQCVYDLHTNPELCEIQLQNNLHTIPI